MNVVELNYLGVLSVRLDRFQVKSNSPYKANARCPICGDSQKSKTKARGWFLDRGDHVQFNCFNCSYNKPLFVFLRDYDENLYREYLVDSRLERFGEKKAEAQAVARPKFRAKKVDLKTISSMDDDHPAKQYVLKRKIPRQAQDRLHYAPRWASWVNTLVPEDKQLKYGDVPRLVFPYLDQKGEMFGFTGRSFDPREELRYMTYMLDDRPKVFGLDRVDFGKPYMVVEGPIDSLFLKNAVAMSGADVSDEALRNLDEATVVFDNEPRNKEIVARMTKEVARGRRVCVWPDWMECKDVNDMVLDGMPPSVVEDTIRENSYTGLRAELELARWRRTA